MADHDVTHLETRIGELRHALRIFQDDSDLQELLKNIHRPGWTTPAELILVSGVLDSVIMHTKVVSELRNVLVKGGIAVGVK